MAGAEEVVAALDRRAERRLRGARRSTSAATTDCSSGARRGPFRLRRERGVQPAQRRRLGRRVASQVAERMLARANADGIRATVTIGAAFGCPFEGEVDPGRVARAGRASRRGRSRRRSSWPTRRRRRPAPSARPRSRASLGSACLSASISTTRATPASRTRTRRSRRASTCSTPPSAASAAARSRLAQRATSRPRISCTCCTARESRPASTSRR